MRRMANGKDQATQAGKNHPGLFEARRRRSRREVALPIKLAELLLVEPSRLQVRVRIIFHSFIIVILTIISFTNRPKFASLLKKNSLLPILKNYALMKKRSNKINQRYM